MRRPIPVLLMVRELGQGGTERQVTEIARTLDRDRFQPYVGCFRPQGVRGEELRRADVPVVAFAVRSYCSLRVLSAGYRMLRYIRERGILLVHTFDVPVQPFGVVTGRLSPGMVVLSSQRAHRDLASPLYRRLLRITDRMVDGVVVNCDFIRRHMIEDEEVPERMIHLCYNGIDLHQFQPQPIDKPSPLFDASLVVGVVCSLRAEKGLDALLGAFSRVRGSHPGAKLAIVGSGAELEKLKSLAASLGITEDVLFEPATTEVPKWLSAIDIFVLPSRSEALSNALMEAMACGCCAVASRVGGNPELITHGETGMLFDDGDVSALACALQLLMEHPEQRRKLAEAGMRSIRERFSLAASTRRMEQIYSALLDRA
jgi:L-malate glycosyltransferase